MNADDKECFREMSEALDTLERFDPVDDRELVEKGRTKLLRFQSDIDQLMAEHNNGRDAPDQEFIAAFNQLRERCDKILSD